MKYLLIIFSVLLVSCMNKQIFIKPLSYDNLTFYSGFLENSFYVYVSPRVELLEFVNTFNNKFGSAESFSNHLRKEFEFRLSLVFDETHQAEIVDPLHELDLYDDENKFLNELKSTVRYNDIEYLIWIQNIAIKNDYKYTPGMMISAGPYGGMTSTGGSTSEDCIVEYRVKVIEVPAWKMVSDFLVTGKKNVVLFSFESTFLSAISNSIDNTIRYLTSGETEKF